MHAKIALHVPAHLIEITNLGRSDDGNGALALAGHPATGDEPPTAGNARSLDQPGDMNVFGRLDRESIAHVAVNNHRTVKINVSGRKIHRFTHLERARNFQFIVREAQHAVSARVDPAVIIAPHRRMQPNRTRPTGRRGDRLTGHIKALFAVSRRMECSNVLIFSDFDVVHTVVVIDFVRITTGLLAVVGICVNNLRIGWHVRVAAGHPFQISIVAMLGRHSLRDDGMNGLTRRLKLFDHVRQPLRDRLINDNAFRVRVTNQ